MSVLGWSGLLLPPQGTVVLRSLAAASLAGQCGLFSAGLGASENQVSAPEATEMGKDLG